MIIKSKKIIRRFVKILQIQKQRFCFVLTAISFRYCTHLRAKKIEIKQFSMSGQISEEIELDESYFGAKRVRGALLVRPRGLIFKKRRKCLC